MADAGCPNRAGHLSEIVRVEAPAKVNLRLRVLAREVSGYHSLETVFCAISLADTLWLRRSGGGIHLSVEGDVDTGPPERNLVVQAAERFQRELGCDLDVEIQLHKSIPSAAGLGGGSSDAAACLLGLNALCGGPFNPERLLQMGAELGSDVPFFLCGSPLALGWGRGERLCSLTPLPERYLLVAHPGEPISSADAFRRIAERRGSMARSEAFSFAPGALQSWPGMAQVAANDFEPPALERIPRLRDAIAAMHDAGAEIAHLSGSGSAIFGIFASKDARDAAAPAIQALRFATWPAVTLREMPRAQVDPSGLAG